MIDIKETVPYMLSEDYKKRLIGEYWQLKIRYKGLMNWAFRHDMKIDWLQKKQLEIMGEYSHVLKMRAGALGISLGEIYHANDDLKNPPYTTIDEPEEVESPEIKEAGSLAENFLEAANRFIGREKGVLA